MTIHHGSSGRKIGESANVSPNFCRGHFPYVSRALPRGLPGCTLNDKQQPIVESARHEDELRARFGFYRYED